MILKESCEVYQELVTKIYGEKAYMTNLIDSGPADFQVNSTTLKLSAKIGFYIETTLSAMKKDCKLLLMVCNYKTLEHLKKESKDESFKESSKSEWEMFISLPPESKVGEKLLPLSHKDINEYAWSYFLLEPT